MKYYATVAPLTEGTFPAGKNIRNVVNFAEKEYVNSIGDFAYGYIVSRSEIKPELAEKYGLKGELNKVWYRVKTYYYQTGRVKSILDGFVLQEERPEHYYHEENGADVHYDFAGTEKGAKDLMDEIRRENLCYAN